MSTSFGKDPQNPKDPWLSDVWDKKPVTGDISDGSGWVIKADKPVVVTEGDGIGGKWPEVIKCSTEFGGIILKVGGDHDIIEDVIKVVIKDPTDTINDGTGFGDVVCVPVVHVIINDPTETIDQEDWFGGSDYIEGEGGYIEGDYGFSGDWGFSGEGLLIEGGWDAKGGDSGYISDTNIPKHEVPKNGDDQYDARSTKEWLDGTGWGRTSEDISDGDFYIMDPTWVGGEGMDIGGGSSNIEDPTWDVRWGGGEGAISGDWGFSGVWDKQDPTWVSAHTCTFHSDIKPGL
jgi:hypothetical protein